jgi:hypothetical protein
MAWTERALSKLLRRFQELLPIRRRADLRGVARIYCSRTINALGRLATTRIQSAGPKGYVLGAGEGECLAHFADAGDLR